MILEAKALGELTYNEFMYMGSDVPKVDTAMFSSSNSNWWNTVMGNTNTPAVDVPKENSTVPISQGDSSTVPDNSGSVNSTIEAAKISEFNANKPALSKILEFLDKVRMPRRLHSVDLWDGNYTLSNFSELKYSLNSYEKYKVLFVSADGNTAYVGLTPSNYSNKTIFYKSLNIQGIGDSLDGLESKVINALKNEIPVNGTNYHFIQYTVIQHGKIKAFFKYFKNIK